MAVHHGMMDSLETLEVAEFFEVFVHALEDVGSFVVVPNG